MARVRARPGPALEVLTRRFGGFTVVLGIVLVLHGLACLYVVRLSRAALVRAGTAAAALAALANLGGLFFGGVPRALATLPILAFTSLAAARAFKMADDVQRDTDEEALASRAGMALVGLAVCEAFALLVAAFVWLLA